MGVSRDWARGLVRWLAHRSDGVAFSYSSWILKARILKWFAIPFSSGPLFVRTLCHDPSVLGGLTWHGS